MSVQIPIMITIDDERVTAAHMAKGGDDLARRIKKHCVEQIRDHSSDPAIWVADYDVRVAIGAPQEVTVH